MNSDPYTKPKRIHVFVNGCATERIFFVHPKCRLSWFSIMNTIAELLKPQSSSVRVLRRVDGRAVSSYEELEENGKYIACGREPLICLEEGYRTESEIELQKELRESHLSKTLSSVPVNVKCLTDPRHADIITIYVFVNGLKTKPYKIGLLDADLDHWTTVCNLISKQLNEPVKYLYTVFGARLKNPSEIQHKGFYVALPEGSSFEDVSYISVFSPKRQRKVRFKQTTQQSTVSEDTVFSKDMSGPNEAGGNREIMKPTEEFNELIPNITEETQLVRTFEVINFNNPTSEAPCIHVTIVQKPYTTVTNHLSAVPATVCATKPSAKLILEMMAEHEHNAVCHICKSTQTNTIFCEAFPKGKCMIEVGSRKFHIISDDDAIVLPCGTYFSSHRSMEKICTFPQGNEQLSFETIANHIVGIVVDTSEYCISRALYGLEESILNEGDKKSEEIVKEEGNLINNGFPDGINGPSKDIRPQNQHQVAT